ncbi:MAG TPA: hypothetical protein VF144_03470 [Chitinophagaceae bacterium]
MDKHFGKFYTGKYEFGTEKKKGDEAEEHYTRVEKGVTKITKLPYKYYSYDGKDNWTQQSTYKNAKLKSVTKRVFTYYKD